MQSPLLRFNARTHTAGTSPIRSPRWLQHVPQHHCQNSPPFTSSHPFGQGSVSSRPFTFYPPLQAKTMPLVHPFRQRTNLRIHPQTGIDCSHLSQKQPNTHGADQVYAHGSTRPDPRATNHLGTPGGTP
eukprot:38457-Chlamydomonas_euryale.AAC.2